MNHEPGSSCLRLPADVARTLRRLAQPAAPRERGGLLLGWWDNGDIVIQRITEVDDPTATLTSWTRHQNAAQHNLNQARAELGDSLTGYVGDWHTHPTPNGISPTDEAALCRASRQYTEPIALLVAVPDGTLDGRVALAGQLQPALVLIDHAEVSQ